MIIRTVFAACLATGLAIGAASSVFAAEESSSSGDRAEPRRAPIYRPLPRQYDVYRPRPVPLGDTCVTRRFSCDLRRLQPIGSGCECRGPVGFHAGVVR